MTSPCYLCGTDTASGVFVHDDSRSRPLLTIACRTCGLIQHAEHPSKEALDHYYSSGAYRREFPPMACGGVEPDAPGYGTMRQYWAAEIVNALERNCGHVTGKQVVEIGAGDLAVSAEMRRRGAEVTAVEPDPTIVPHGVYVVPALPARPYKHTDLLVAFQVFEHQDDPVGVLRSWLSHGHMVYLELPNAAAPYVSLTHFLQYPHVTTWNPRTLMLAAFMAGAREILIDQPGTVLSARLTGCGEPMTYEAASARFASGWTGVDSAAQLIGAFA